VVLGIAVALAAGTVVLALILALLAVAVGAAFLLGGAWLTWKVGRAIWAGNQRGRTHHTARAVSRVGRREVRGLLEMAATPNPLEQYLIAVREFERISAAALALDPQDVGSRRTARRVWTLAEQADNLAEAVADVERRLMSDPSGQGARSHAWELALASRDVCHYLDRLGDVRRSPSLGELRGLIAHRAELVSRRAALVDRLDSVEMTRALPAR
jgi:hypothetical protein